MSLHQEKCGVEPSICALRDLTSSLLGGEDPESARDTEMRMSVGRNPRANDKHALLRKVLRLGLRCSAPSVCTPSAMPSLAGGINCATRSSEKLMQVQNSTCDVDCPPFQVVHTAIRHILQYLHASNLDNGASAPHKRVPSICDYMYLCSKLHESMGSGQIERSAVVGIWALDSLTGTALSLKRVWLSRAVISVYIFLPTKPGRTAGVSSETSC